MVNVIVFLLFYFFYVFKKSDYLKKMVDRLLGQLISWTMLCYFLLYKLDCQLSSLALLQYYMIFWSKGCAILDFLFSGVNNHILYRVAYSRLQ